MEISFFYLFAALQQMKHAYLSSNKWYLDITWLMFEFQKTGFIDKKENLLKCTWQY